MKFHHLLKNSNTTKKTKIGLANSVPLRMLLSRIPRKIRPHGHKTIIPRALVGCEMIIANLPSHIQRALVE